jgi:hypothetical protein
LYVDNLTTSCTDSGTGTQAAPFCTVQAAANAAVAGDTVLITGSEESYYDAAGTTVTVSHSGTASAPIIFEAASGGPDFQLQSPLLVSGSYVEFVHGNLGYVSGVVTITGSHVTFDRDTINGPATSAVAVGANVSNLTIERSKLASEPNGTDIQLSAGDSNTLLTTDTFYTASSYSLDPVIAVAGAKNTDIVSNTIEGGCNTAISLTNAVDTTIENNIVTAGLGCSYRTPTDLVVDKASSTSTTEGYNIVGAERGVTVYNWAGSFYSTQVAFAAATGQGKQDVVDASIDLGTDSLTEDADAQGTANAAAPGELSTDVYGNTWPRSAPDRGAVAFEQYTSSTFYASNFAPQQIGVTLDLQGLIFYNNDITVTINWGDGSNNSFFDVGGSLVTGGFSDIADSRMYHHVGTYTVTMTLQAGSLSIVKTATVSTTGGTYVPVSPSRVLDTRQGLGAPKAKLASEGTLPVNIVRGVTVPPGIGTISAVVMNVTVTNPTAGGNISAYPGGTAKPVTSNLNYSPGETVPNLVTVLVGPGDVVDLHNDSPGSTDLVADVEGYYVQSTSGSYYLGYTPQRIMDTRDGLGGVTGPIAANGTASVSVPQCVSGTGSTAQTATATAVALNVTVTDGTLGGHITAYPDGTTLPNSSNLNFGKGETVPNLVVVKVGADGKVDLANVGSGTVQFVVDLEGCYSASLGGAFVPITPYRALDTRYGIGQDSSTGKIVGPNSNAFWDQSNSLFPLDGSYGATSIVMNVTVTQPTAAGNIIAYPYSSGVPGTSNLNFNSGETVPNLVMLPLYAGWRTSLYNNSTGKVDLIADYYGYFS